MKIGNLIINKKYVWSIAVIVLIVSSVVGYSYVNSDLDYSSNVTVKKPCTQDNLYDRLSCMANIDSLKSKYVQNDAPGINFTRVSSDTNGKGLYTLSTTVNDDYPVHYYRGAVTNNNVKFANICWKIVRTTDTGGTKLIYNGTPNGSGGCTNTTEDATQIDTKAYNEENLWLVYTGYKFGNISSFGNRIMNDSDDFTYGNGFSYTGGTYTLTNTANALDNTHHYTCFNNGGTCSEIYYVYFTDVNNNNNYYFYVTLTQGKNIDDALTEMYSNTNDSLIKSTVDNWFNTTLTPYFTNKGKTFNDYLEDTIWCNDREMNTLSTDQTLINNGWIPNGGSTTNYLYYAAWGRINSMQAPSLICSSKNNSFTVTESVTGNGVLTYPVGLLTADEAMLAGCHPTNDTTSYLVNNHIWWTMTPAYQWHYWLMAHNYVVTETGHTADNRVSEVRGVRPSISLKYGMIISSGDGSSDTPYVIE